MMTLEDPEGLSNLNFILAHNNVGIKTNNKQPVGNYYRKHLKTTATRIFLEVDIFNLEYKERKTANETFGSPNLLYFLHGNQTHLQSSKKDICSL